MQTSKSMFAIKLLRIKITALVIPTTMLVNFITTLSIATGSVVIMITSCVIEGSRGDCPVRSTSKPKNRYHPLVAVLLLDNSIIVERDVALGVFERHL